MAQVDMSQILFYWSLRLRTLNKLLNLIAINSVESIYKQSKQTTLITFISQSKKSTFNKSIINFTSIITIKNAINKDCCNVFDNEIDS